jgi:hypothetical protein
MIFKPPFHVWLVWKTIDMLAGQHHLTIDEIEEGVTLYIQAFGEKHVMIVQPKFDPSVVRAGTPVSCREV